MSLKNFGSRWRVSENQGFRKFLLKPTTNANPVLDSSIYTAARLALVLTLECISRVHRHAANGIDGRDLSDLHFANHFG